MPVWIGIGLWFYHSRSSVQKHTHSLTQSHTHTHTRTAHEYTHKPNLMIAPCQMMTFSIGHNYTKHSLSCFGSNRMIIVSGPRKYLTFCIWIFPCFLLNFPQGEGSWEERVSSSLIQPKIVNSSFICVLFIVNSPASICVAYLSISIIFRLVLSTLVHIEISGTICSMLLSDIHMHRCIYIYIYIYIFIYSYIEIWVYVYMATVWCSVYVLLIYDK